MTFSISRQLLPVQTHLKVAAAADMKTAAVMAAAAVLGSCLSAGGWEAKADRVAVSLAAAFQPAGRQAGAGTLEAVPVMVERHSQQARAAIALAVLRRSRHMSCQRAVPTAVAAGALVRHFGR